MEPRSIKDWWRAMRNKEPTAKDLIVKEIAKASEGNDRERWNELLKQLTELESGKDIADQHEKLMDKSRLFVAAVLILGLIASVFFAMKQNPQATAQYLSLVSGLAGIAIGWLYGNNFAQRTNKRSRQRDNDSKQANQTGGTPARRTTTRR